MAEKKKQVKQLHPTRSFEDMMAKAQLKALEPYIAQQVAVVGRHNLMQLSQLLLNHLAEVKLRSFAIESLLKDKLGVTDNDISERVSAEEDRMFGYSEVEGPAQEGDLVRFDSVSNLGPQSKRQPLSGKVAVQGLASKNPQGEVQTIEEVERALIGASKGESRTVELDADVPEGSASYTVSMRRVSRKNS